MKFKTIVSTFAITCCLLVGNVLQTRAQSTDSTSPEQLTTNVVQCDAEPNGQSYYYSFVAGPGDVTVNIDGSTDFYSTTTQVIFTDAQGRELSSVPVAATSSGAKKAAKLHLPSKQNVTMKVMFGLDVGVHAKYKIALGGAVSLAGTSATSGTAIAMSPPPQNFDAKDNGMAPSTPTATTAARPPEVATTSGVIESKDAAEDNSSPIEDKWALVVGVSKFAQPRINLKYPAKDAKDLATFLTTEANFAPDHVKLLVDEEATKERVLAELGDKWLPRLARPNDLVLIFISSHGSSSKADLEGLNYLVMHNTDPDSLYATGLPIADLANAIKHRVHSNRVVLIIDACHSGAATPSKGVQRVGNIDTSLLQGTGQLIICSSAQNQLSWESKRYQNGVFTRQLIESLRQQKGKPTMGQAFEHLKDAVESEVLQDRKELQTAIMKSKWKGNELIISAPPTKPRKAELDEY